jgi:hypothetical protein
MSARPLSLPSLTLALLLGSLHVVHAAPVTAAGLSKGFAAPPESAALHTWWEWMNGNVTKAGITADLEAMHRVGISYATICVFDLGEPAGPIRFRSPEFFEMVRFAASEAKRLGMTIGLENGAGWSSSGGPWVTPENSMQKVVTSEKTIAGPATFSGILPEPPKQKDYYRDIRVLAFPALEGDGMHMGSASPTVTASVADFHDPNSRGYRLPYATRQAPQYLQFEFPHPFAARTLILDLPSDDFGSGRIEASDDGRNFRTLRAFFMRAKAGMQSYAIPPTSARSYRITFFGTAGHNVTGMVIHVDMLTAARIDNYLARCDGASTRVNDNEFETGITPAPPDCMVVHSDKMVDLTSKMDATGKLTWNVPAGKWTILRVGYTTNGMTNHPAPPEGLGLECDKLSRPAATAFWDGLLTKVTKDLGPLTGVSFTHTLIDSYEVGYQNWSPVFAAEFRKRRGYDLLPYLPLFTGRIVDSTAISERVLWDVRRTIADLFADNYYGYFATLAHQHGITLDVEPYGDGPFDDILSGRDVDRVMGEFWWPAGGYMDSVKLAASIAHIYGKTIVGAESFTSDDGGWDMSPPTMKMLGDRAFASGINSMTFDRYAMQPWLNRWPGMTMGIFGSDTERTNTWWEQGRAWLQYLSRCGYLLQQGRFVADVLIFEGEGAPVSPPIPPASVLPAGYDYDSCDTDVILHRLAVRNGNLVLPNGASYRVLDLPRAKKMTPGLLRKLKELADAGATIMGGPAPNEAPGLTDYPKCDAEVKTLAADLWSNGKIISDKTLPQVIASLKIQPDFEAADKAAKLLYIHRSIGRDDLYFISNQSNCVSETDALFRVTGKTPEFWHADSGLSEKVPAYSEEQGRTRIPLRLDPAGSVFILFRGDEPPPADHPVSLVRTGASSSPFPDAQLHAAGGAVTLEASQPATYSVKMADGQTRTIPVTGLVQPLPVPGPWTLAFPPNWGAPATVTFDKLISWPDSPDAGIKYFSGTATYRKTLSIPSNLLGSGRRLYLDLGDVQVIARLSLNGKELGILWKPPYCTEITVAAHPGDNHLEIQVTNLWPNRIIGDEQLPEDSDRDPSGAIKSWPQWLRDGKPSPTGRFTFATFRHWKKSDPLFPSGLIGPVTLRPTVELPLP